MPHIKNAAYANGAGATTLENDLRLQRALELGPSDPKHLRLVAREIEDEGVLELPGVDAERLRLLARQLEDDADELGSLRAYADILHRALCEAIDDLEAAGADQQLVFLFIPGADERSTRSAALTPEQFSDLLVYLLDEVE